MLKCFFQMIFQNTTPGNQKDKIKSERCKGGTINYSPAVNKEKAQERCFLSLFGRSDRT